MTGSWIAVLSDTKGGNVTKIVWGTYPISRVVTQGILSRATVVWWFERGAEVMRLTASKDTRTGEHVLQIVDSGRSALTERYQRYPEYLARVLALDQRLTDQYWSQVEVQQRYPATSRSSPQNGQRTSSLTTDLPSTSRPTRRAQRRASRPATRDRGFFAAVKSRRT